MSATPQLSDWGPPDVFPDNLLLAKKQIVELREANRHLSMLYESMCDRNKLLLDMMTQAGYLKFEL